MIDLVERLLRRLGVLPPFSVDDMINASIEDKAREHQASVDKLHDAFMGRLQTNERLRRSISIAKRRTDSFANIEKLIRGEGMHRD